MTMMMMKKPLLHLLSSNHHPLVPDYLLHFCTPYLHTLYITLDESKWISINTNARLVVFGMRKQIRCKQVCLRAITSQREGFKLESCETRSSNHQFQEQLVFKGPAHMAGWAWCPGLVPLVSPSWVIMWMASVQGGEGTDRLMCSLMSARCHFLIMRTAQL